MLSASLYTGDLIARGRPGSKLWSLYQKPEPLVSISLLPWSVSPTPYLPEFSSFSTCEQSELYDIKLVFCCLVVFFDIVLLLQVSVVVEHYDNTNK